MCLGSDFDGLIDPVYSFRTSEEWQEFKRKLNKHIIDAPNNYVTERSGPELPIDGKLGGRIYIRQLMYDNGKRFMEE